MPTEDLQAEIDAINENYKVSNMWDGITVPKGWHRLIIDTHNKLLEIDPDYRIQQVKNKFGSLRYYCTIPYSGGTHDRLNDEELERAQKIITDAEFRSSETCQFCGNEDARLMCGGMWYVTACPNCATENELVAMEVEDEDDD